MGCRFGHAPHTQNSSQIQPLLTKYILCMPQAWLQRYNYKQPHFFIKWDASSRTIKRSWITSCYLFFEIQHSDSSKYPPLKTTRKNLCLIKTKNHETFKTTSHLMSKTIYHQCVLSESITGWSPLPQFDVFIIMKKQKRNSNLKKTHAFVEYDECSVPNKQECP
jgi:hypothetical protein